MNLTPRETAEALLETYELEDILAISDMTPEDALTDLIEFANFEVEPMLLEAVLFNMRDV